MPSYANILLAAAALSGVASAAPAPAPAANEVRSGGFSVTQVRNPNFSGKVKSGALARAKAYMKFGAPMPDDLKAVVANHTASLIARRSQGSAKTTPDSGDNEWLTPVSIGTPAQKLNLDFDTGSSDLWVFSSETPKSSINGQSVYSPSKSSTASQMSGYSWDISYGDGSSSSGDVYTDVVNVGGVSFAKQAVEAAKKVSSEFTADSDNDGLLGLAFSSINTVSPKTQKTFFDNVKSSLDSPVFTADLKHGKAGKYNFGYIDDSAYTGDLTYTSVSTSDGFWTFTASGYGVGSDYTKTKVKGIADTGTTLLLLPDSVCSAYYKQVSGSSYSDDAGGYVFPCSADMPEFTFGVGSSKITIPSDYMNFQKYSGSTCYGGLQPNDGIGFSIFGDVALKAAFVVFEGSSSPRLGFASKKL